MADTKLTGLTANTAPVLTDLLYIVDDPGGTPASQKITIADLAKLVGRVLISEQTPNGTGTVTWDSIPATYKSLEIEFVCHSTLASTTTDNLKLWLNNDTIATNYRTMKNYNYAASTNDTAGADDSVFTFVPANDSPAGGCGFGTIKIIQYAGTTFNKMVGFVGGERRDTSSVNTLSMQSTIEWESASAITRVDLVLATGNYAIGSTFRLYGVY